VTPEKRLTGDAMGDLRGRNSQSNIAMSYTTRKTEALGDTWDTVKSMSSAVDPYLPEAFCRIDQMRALKTDRTPLQAMFGKKPTVPVPTCSTTPPGKKGIGVERAMKPLRAGVFVYRSPIVVWLGLTAVLMVPFIAGYAVGKKRK
jgi:hypothetical protein